MNRDIWIKQSRAISEGMDSLRWYQRTRPGAAERLLLGPAFCVFVTLVFAVVWGELHLIVLALVLVGAFAVLAGQLTGELRERELEARSSRAARPEVAPLLARIAEPRSEDKPEPTAVDSHTPALERFTEAEPASPEPVLDPAHDVSILARLDVERDSEPIALSSHQPIEVDEPQSPLAPDVEVAPRADSEPVHEVREPGVGPALHMCATFLDACDFAFEFIDENDPAELEIVRVAGDTRDTVWSYARTDAIASRESVDDTERFLAMIARQSWRRDDHRTTRLRGTRRRRA